jgi:hypothetical protein
MTKNEINTILKETAAKHGFTTEESNWYRWPNITEQGTHYLNFTITESFAPDTDWSKREITMNLTFRASLASMGGNPTHEDLLKASEIIRRGAELVRELEVMKLSYTEEF